MLLYSICSLCIEAEALPNSYQAFLFSNANHPPKIDLSIKSVKSFHNHKHLLKVAELSNMTIWKENYPDNSFHWVYKANNGSAIFSVDSEYSNVEFKYFEPLEFLGHEKLADIISPYIQMIIKCKLTQKGFLILHAACIEKNGISIALTGPSGIGKSSRAKKMCELLSAELISGDRPIIDTSYGIAYGAPWDGKEAVYRNTSSPLSIILNVNRSNMTMIKDMYDADKLHLLCEQVFFPMWDPCLVATSMRSIKRLIQKTPICELYSNLNDESIYQAYGIIEEKIKKK